MQKDNKKDNNSVNISKFKEAKNKFAHEILKVKNKPHGKIFVFLSIKIK